MTNFGLTQEFNSLPQAEQMAVYEAIARKLTPANYGPLSDEEHSGILRH